MKKIAAFNLLLFLALSAVCARIAADLIAYRLVHSLPTRQAAGKTSAAHTDEGLASFAPILEKGLFGKGTIGKLMPLAAAPAAKATGGATREDLVLLGTAIGSFRETFALIQRTSTHEERVFRLGDQVFGIGPLVKVRKEQVEIKGEGGGVTLATPTAAGADPAAGGLRPPVSGNHLATQTAAGSYVIDQKALNATLDNIGQAMTDARLLPSMREGKVEGFRVSEVKPTGIFAMVGIRNGDTLLKINDFPIDSPEKAIQSLGSLRGQNRIRLDLIRDGQPATFSYDIR